MMDRLKMGSNETEVELVLSGSTVKVAVKDESLPYARTSERVKITNALKERNIGYSSMMSTGGLGRLLERHKDKIYFPLPEHVYIRRYTVGMLRECVVCKTEFTITKYNQKYCSKECRKKAKGMKAKRRYEEEKRIGFVYE